LLDGSTNSERAQDADAVRLHREARSDGLPRRATLDELRPESLLMQGRGEREAGDTSAHDQDSVDVGHLLLLSADRSADQSRHGVVYPAPPEPSRRTRGE